METTIKQIVILGGSYGGISTTHYLLKHVIPKLPDSSSFEVVLVSASSEILLRPACPRALISDDYFPQGKLFVSITKQFEQYPSRFRFIHGKAIDLDHLARTVSISISSSTTILIFYALIIATGTSTPCPLFGLNQDDAPHLRQTWKTFRSSLPTAKNIIIAGGGPTGVETAGELGEHLNGRSSGSARSSPKVPITLVTASPRILPRLRESISHQAESYLAQLGVQIITNAKVTSVNPQDPNSPASLLLSQGGPISSVTVSTSISETQTLLAEIYIPCLGTTPNTQFINPHGPSRILLQHEPSPSSKIQTNPSTLRVDVAGPKSLIYSIGDVSTVAANPSIHNILSAVPVLCANIKTDLIAFPEPTSSGGGGGGGGNVDLVSAARGSQDEIFKEDMRETQLVPVGRTKGVGAMIGWRVPSWLVWLVKGRDYWLWTTGRLWSGRQW